LLKYTSPAICEAVFSSSSFPTLVLLPTPVKAKVSGLVLTYLGDGGDFELNWNNYPGALCYSVYKLRNTIDPFSDYILVAECITDPKYDPNDWPLDNPNEPGCYVITAITAEGETEFGDPICNGCYILPEGPFNALASEIYSQQLEIAGLPVTPDSAVWSITDGALPLGVTLNPATGLISGTVGEVGVFTFTVTVNGSIGYVAFIGTHEYQMIVTTTAIELDFNLLVWGTPYYGLDDPNATGTSSGSWVQNHWTVSAAGNGVPVSGQYGLAQNTANLTYTGPEVLCNLHLEVTVYGPDPGLTNVPIVIQQDGVDILSTNLAGLPPVFGTVGSYDIPFTVAAGTDSFIEVTQAAVQSFNEHPGVTYTATLTPAV
jgi:hypothetical protein